MSEKYKNIEGALDVNGDVNPVTREKIEQVTAGDWADMSAGELHHQKGILLQRMNAAASFSPTMIPAIKRGIAQIEALIAQKSNNDDNIGLM